MSDQRARTAGDYLGFFAYLAIMNGGWPDRDLLSAGYAGAADQPPEGRQRQRPHLSIVRVPPEPASSDETDADIAAA